MFFLCLLWSALAILADAQDLLSFLESRSDLYSFYDNLLRTPDFLAELNSLRNITIFAPINRAFGPFPLRVEYDTSEDIINGEDEEALTNLWRYHVIKGTWSADALATQSLVLYSTLYDNGLVSGGQVISASEYVGRIAIDSGTMFPAHTIKTDLPDAPSGVVVHTIDRFLELPLPLSVMAKRFGRFHDHIDPFVAALQAADLLDEFETLPDVTMFAPYGPLDVDTEEVLRFHIIPDAILTQNDFDMAANGTEYETLLGEKIVRSSRMSQSSDGYRFDRTTVNGVRIRNGRLEEDILIANGILQIVNGTLIPPASAKTASSDGEGGGQDSQSQGAAEATGGASGRASMVVSTLSVLAVVAAYWAI